MKPKKYGLSFSEIAVIKMIHDLYGKRYHHYRECFINEEGEIHIFIKNRHGESQFSVNLTFLSTIQNISTVQIQEKYLMPDFAGKSHLPRCKTKSSCRHLTLIPEQLPKDDYSPVYERLAS